MTGLPQLDREELLGDAIRALIRGDIKCSDDLPPEKRPVGVSARRAFGAVYDLVRARNAGVPELTGERPLFDPAFPEQGYVSDAEWARRRGAKADTSEQRLLEILAVVQQYLPPDGLDAEEAMSRITALVDPMPRGVGERDA